MVTVDLRLVKEIRQGINSRDFSRVPEEPRNRHDLSLCFMLLFGCEFRLKPLSLSGKCIWYIHCDISIMCVTYDHSLKTQKIQSESQKNTFTASLSAKRFCSG